MVLLPLFKECFLLYMYQSTHPFCVHIIHKCKVGSTAKLLTTGMVPERNSNKFPEDGKWTMPQIMADRKKGGMLSKYGHIKFY